jgi:protein SCO1/2
MLKRSMLGVAAVWAVAAAVTTAGLAHQPRGQIVHEHATSHPAEPGYAPPDPAKLGGAFEMVDHTGRRVTHETFRGKLVLMFFGFHGCRESCPTSLDKIAPLLERLGPDAEKVQPVFVDVSMGKMDVRGLAEWVANFHPRLVGLTGSRAERFEIVRLFQVRREYKHNSYSRRETGPRLDHSTYFYIVDAAGRTRTYFYHTLSPEEMAAAVRKWL